MVREARLSVNDKTTYSDEVYFTTKACLYICTQSRYLFILATDSYTFQIVALKRSLLPSPCRSRELETFECEVSWETGTFDISEAHLPESRDLGSGQVTPETEKIIKVLGPSWWSSGRLAQPSITIIQVRILLKSTIFLLNCCWKETNKQNEAGVGSSKIIIVFNWTVAQRAEWSLARDTREHRFASSHRHIYYLLQVKL